MRLPAALSTPGLSRYTGLPADAPAPRWVTTPAPPGSSAATQGEPLWRPLPAPWYLSGVARLGWFVVVLLGCATLAVSGLVTLGARVTDERVQVALRIAVPLVAYFLLVHFLERRRPPIELAPRRAFGLVIGLALGAALFALCFGLIALLGGYRFAGFDTHYEWALPVLILGPVAAIGEEIALRGVLFRLVEQHLGTWLAAALSGGVFGLIHLGNPQATPLGALAIALAGGGLLGLLYALTRSLWVVVGVHAAWNIVQGPVLGVPVSGSGIDGGWVKTTAVGPDWLTGGSFGAEASAVTVLVLMIVTALLAWELVRTEAVVAPAWTRRERMRAVAVPASR